MGRDGRGRIRRVKDNVCNSNLPTGMKLQWGPYSRFPSCVHHHHSPTISGAPYTMGISPCDTADHVTSIMGRSGEGCVAEMVERKQLDLVIKAAWEENDFSSTLSCACTLCRNIPSPEAIVLSWILTLRMMSLCTLTSGRRVATLCLPISHLQELNTHIQIHSCSTQFQKCIHRSCDSHVTYM